MAKIILSAALQGLTHHQSSVEIDATTIQDALQQLCNQFTALKPYLFNEFEDINPFICVYCNDEDVRDKLNQSISGKDEIQILTAQAGG
jgi:molybdopterin converting factor small subunit